MFRNLFSPQGWERLGFRLKEKAVDVLDYEFDFLSRVMKAHRLFDHPYFLNPLYGGLSASKQGEVLALILYEKALEVMIKNNKFDHEDSKTMSGYSIKLDPSDSNPAWLLESVFMAADDSVSNELLHAHIPRALYATNHIAEKYKALLNINTPELYGLHAVRAPVLYLTLEQRAKENLSEEDLTTLIAALDFEVEGIKLKKALHGHFAHDDQPSEEALHYANRVLAHGVYLIAAQLMQKFQLKQAVLFLKCAASVNPNNYSARIDLAQLLHDADRALPGEGYGYEAVMYAHEVVFLIERQAYDLSPEIPIGYSTYTDKAKIAKDLQKMYEISNAYEK